LGTCALAALSGCAAPNVPPTVDTAGLPNTEIALRQSLWKVDAEMIQLGNLTPAAGESVPVVPAELQKMVGFTWQGSLDDAIRTLAASIGYGVSVTTPKKSVPLPVTIDAGPEQVFQLFQKLGEIAGTRATVQLDPPHHEVEVIHHV
jgi:defect-in-organelle-trafficking protein DotD